MVTKGHTYLSKPVAKSCRFVYVFMTFCYHQTLTFKDCRDQFDPSAAVFPKVYLPERARKRLKPWFFLTFNIIISHIFPENFDWISEVVQKIWRFSLSILTIFIDFFLTSAYMMISAFFKFKSTLNRLLNNWIKLYQY